jgi:hypothetical protein
MESGPDFIMLPSPREYEYLLDERSVIAVYASKVSTSLASSQTQSHALFAILENSPGVKPYSCGPCIPGDNNWVTNCKLLAVRHFGNENITPARRAGRRQNPIIDPPFRIDCRRSPRKTTSAALGKETLRWTVTEYKGSSIKKSRREDRIAWISDRHFQYALFNTQSETGLPAPLGTAIKINPESLNDSAFLPATGPAPVYLST